MTQDTNQLPDVIRDIERVPADIAAQAGKFQAAILADVAGRRGAMHGRIQALRPRMQVAGPAFTVEVRPGDNLMIHAAIALVGYCYTLVQIRNQEYLRRYYGSHRAA